MKSSLLQLLLRLFRMTIGIILPLVLTIFIIPTWYTQHSKHNMDTVHTLDTVAAATTGAALTIHATAVNNVQDLTSQDTIFKAVLALIIGVVTPIIHNGLKKLWNKIFPT